MTTSGTTNATDGLVFRCSASASVTVAASELTVRNCLTRLAATWLSSLTTGVWSLMASAPVSWFFMMTM